MTLWVMNGPEATSALSPFDSQLRTLVGAPGRVEVIFTSIASTIDFSGRHSVTTAR
jgi:hypothetical protein